MKTFTVKNYDFHRPSLFFTVLEVTVEKGEGGIVPMMDGMSPWVTMAWDGNGTVTLTGRNHNFYCNQNTKN